MHPILSKTLKARGIEDYTKLTDDEKVEFDNWAKILSKDEVTIERIEEFCNIQLGTIEAQFGTDLETGKAERLMLLHSVYKSLKKMISGPKAERESLEVYLTSKL